MYGCFVFKQNTSYDMRIMVWSADVCPSELSSHESRKPPVLRWWPHRTREGSAACRARCLKDRAIHVGIRCGSWICTRQSLLGLPAKNFHRFQCHQSDVGNIVECHGKASQLGVVIDDLDKERPVVFEIMAPVHEIGRAHV